MIGVTSDAGKHDKHAKSDKEDRKMKRKNSQVNFRYYLVVLFKNKIQFIIIYLLNQHQTVMYSNAI